MSFYIGNVKIDGKAILAPMAGITNAPFRLLASTYGAAYTVSEMISDKAIGFKNEKTLKMLNILPDEKIVAIQLFGHELDSMREAAKFICENTRCDFLNINMGCPVNKVAKKSNAGASLMKDPSYVYKLVKEIVDNVDKPVTVKIRAGWDQNSLNAVEVALAAEKAGASAVTVHGRTRMQMYRGKADLDIIKAVKEALSIPVIGNGDITCAQEAKHMLDYTKVDAVMIARGALGNPYIFREINEYLETGIALDKPSFEDKYNLILKHYDLLKAEKGEHLATLEMRSHVGWYLKGFPRVSALRGELCKETDFENVKKILFEYKEKLEKFEMK